MNKFIQMSGFLQDYKKTLVKTIEHYIFQKCENGIFYVCFMNEARW